MHFGMRQPSPFATLETQRLHLRMPSLEGVPAIYAIHANPETHHHNPAGPMKEMKEAEERVTEWIKNWSEHGIGYWFVSTLDSPQVIGVSGVRVMEWSGKQVLNLYYRYGPEVWGQGYATELASQALQVAHEHLPELPVIARVRPNNFSSRKVAERVGLLRRPDLDAPEHVVYVSWWA